jgi:hypothetical protein
VFSVEGLGFEGQGSRWGYAVKVKVWWSGPRKGFGVHYRSRSLTPRLSLLCAPICRSRSLSLSARRQRQTLPMPHPKSFTRGVP